MSARKKISLTMETFHEDVRLQMQCKICDKELPTVGGWGCAITSARWGVSTRSCSGGRTAAATACHAANTPPTTYRMNAANGMRRYTRIPLPVVMQL